MNKKLLSLIVPVFGFMAIIGSGFSAWHFGKVATSVDASAAGHGTVEDVVTFNDAELKFNINTVYLKLDQDALVGAADYTDKGLTYDTLTYTLSMDQDMVDYLEETGYQSVKFSVEVTGNDGFGTYVNTTVTKASAALATSIEGNVEFAWTSNKPVSLDNYTNMLNLLSADSTTKSFDFNVKVTATLSTDAA